MSTRIIEQTIDFVKHELRSAEGGHDWFHIERVWKNAREIGGAENVNMLVVELAALLHDIADSKFHDGNEDLGPERARNFLASAGVDIEIMDKVDFIIRNISFRSGLGSSTAESSAELEVVRDADRLDAIGAIGIARAFHYGGFKNRPMYDPSIPPQVNQTKEEYKKSNAPTINHFYEKLLLLKDLMHTAKGKELAQRRHQFMLEFLEEFYGEVDEGLLIR
jgi:uncharacterized protein